MGCFLFFLQQRERALAAAGDNDDWEAELVLHLCFWNCSHQVFVNANSQLFLDFGAAPEPAAQLLPLLAAERACLEAKICAPGGRPMCLMIAMFGAIHTKHQNPAHPKVRGFEPLGADSNGGSSVAEAGAKRTSHDSTVTTDN